MQPAEIAYEMLQQLPHQMFLASSSQDVTTMTLMPNIEAVAETEGSRDLLLAYLQEIKSQFTSQATIDDSVFAQCQAIRLKIEENPAFESMMNF